MIKKPNVGSRWFSGHAQITTISAPWMLGSKLLALYGRKKGRDLFDLAASLRNGLAKADEIVDCFLNHLQESSHTVTRAQFEENLYYKIHDDRFLLDLPPLLSGAIEAREEATFEDDYELVARELIARLPGAPWKGHHEKKDGG